MTLTPAEIYGVADRLGSIEKGKIANLIVTKGDFFDDQTKVKYIFVDGKKFDPAPEVPPQHAAAHRTPTGERGMRIFLLLFRCCALAAPTLP